MTKLKTDGLAIDKYFSIFELNGQYPPGFSKGDNLSKQKVGYPTFITVVERTCIVFEIHYIFNVTFIARVRTYAVILFFFFFFFFNFPTLNFKHGLYTVKNQFDLLEINIILTKIKTITTTHNFSLVYLKDAARYYINVICNYI